MSSQYGTAFSEMRSRAGSVWQQYTCHPFVRGMEDGSLSRAAFLHYLQQDYVFLIHFSRAWALAVVKSETLEEMQLAVSTVNALVCDEIKLHVAQCAQAGISEETLFATRERPENLAYTRFVLEVGYSGDFLDLLAALAPCVLGYGEIGQRLSQHRTSATYQDWIDTYAGAEYQHACVQVGQLLDRSLIQRLGEDYTASPRWGRLCQIFQTATELEVGFWEMGLQP